MDLPSTYIKGLNSEKDVLKMTYTKLHQDIKLSKLGFGGGTFGQVYGNVEEADAKMLLHEAIKCGINYIDTSPYYGHTQSEKMFGKVLVGIPREAYYISTKVGRYGTTFDHSYDRIQKEFDNSLKYLGLDYVDILFVHDVEFSPIDQILKEALPAVQSLKSKKKTNYIGISGYPLSVLQEIVEKSPVQIDVVLTYARNVLFDATVEDYLSFFANRGVALINASMTGMGLLTNYDPPTWHPALQDLKELCHNAGLYCKEQGVSLAKLALYHSLQLHGFTSHLVGVKSMEELEEDIEVATNGLTDKEKEVLIEIKQRFFNSDTNYHWEGVEIEQRRKAQEAAKEK